MKKETALFPAMVVRTTGAYCTLRLPSGEKIEAIVRGKFRINRNLNTTNPVAVGDEILYHIPENGEIAVVTDILDRKNFLIRRAAAHAHKVHILCANIDQAVLVFTHKSPRTSMGFINRFLVIAEAYQIPATLLFNKMDTANSPEEIEHLAEIQHCYEQAGYPVLRVSALDAAYKTQLSDLFAGKISFLGGHSGAGKSSILNLLQPDLSLRTQAVSTYNDKGMHTTTFSEMYELATGGYVIDAPGIKEMGLVNFNQQELGHYFPEIRSRMHLCKYNNCTHTREKSCAILAAVAAGEIPEGRYQSYLNIWVEQ